MPDTPDKPEAPKKPVPTPESKPGSGPAATPKPESAAPVQPSRPTLTMPERPVLPTPTEAPAPTSQPDDPTSEIDIGKSTPMESIPESPEDPTVVTTTPQPIRGAMEVFTETPEDPTPEFEQPIAPPRAAAGSTPPPDRIGRPDPRRRRDGREPRDFRGGESDEDGPPQPALNEETIAVNRVMKVVKGGRVLRFSAVVAVGDGDGRVGVGTGKAREVSQAIQKAAESARRAMVKINLVNGTIYHEIQGRHGASRIHMQPASEGTGIIAGGPARKLLQVAGARDILAKNIGSTNPGNILRAALNALQAVRTPVEVAARRGLPIKEMQKRHRLLG